MLYIKWGGSGKRKAHRDRGGARAVGRRDDLSIEQGCCAKEVAVLLVPLLLVLLAVTVVVTVASIDEERRVGRGGRRRHVLWAGLGHDHLELFRAVGHKVGKHNADVLVQKHALLSRAYKFEVDGVAQAKRGRLRIAKTKYTFYYCWVCVLRKSSTSFAAKTSWFHWACR